MGRRRNKTVALGRGARVWAAMSLVAALLATAAGSANAGIEPVLVIPGSVGVAEGDAGDETIVQVPVRLSAPSPEDVTVAWSTLDTGAGGTATEDEDYVPDSGVVFFEPGETEAFVEITVLGDDVYEPDGFLGEWGFVQFSDPVGAEFDSGLFSTTGIFIIVDNEPIPVLTPGAGIVTEGAAGSQATVSISVELSRASARDITADWSTVDGTAPVATAGSDYIAASGTVTFLAGQKTATIDVTVLGDDLDEPPAYLGEWGLVSFSNLDGALLDVDTLFGLGIFVIVDDD